MANHDGGSVSPSDDDGPTSPQGWWWDPRSLSQWVEICTALTDCAGGALVLSPRGTDVASTVLHATDSVAEQVADVFYLVGTSPHAHTLRDGSVHQVSLSGEGDPLQCPVLVTELSGIGVSAVRVYPVGASDTTFGSLQLHWSTSRPPSTPTGRRAPDETVHRAARRIGEIVARTGIVATSSERISGAETACDDATVAAIDILAARYRTTSSDASALLRAGAFSRSLTSAAHARSIIASTERGDPLF